MSEKQAPYGQHSEEELISEAEEAVRLRQQLAEVQAQAAAMRQVLDFVIKNGHNAAPSEAYAACQAAREIPLAANALLLEKQAAETKIAELEKHFTWALDQHAEELVKRQAAEARVKELEEQLSRQACLNIAATVELQQRARQAEARVKELKGQVEKLTKSLRVIENASIENNPMQTVGAWMSGIREIARDALAEQEAGDGKATEEKLRSLLTYSMEFVAHAPGCSGGVKVGEGYPYSCKCGFAEWLAEVREVLGKDNTETT